MLLLKDHFVVSPWIPTDLRHELCSNQLVQECIEPAVVSSEVNRGSMPLADFKVLGKVESVASSTVRHTSLSQSFVGLIKYPLGV